MFLLLFSHQVMSDSSQPHGLQHTRLPCPSPSPGICPSSCPLNQWCHPTISSSVTLFSSAFNLSKNQGFFQWVSYLHQVAKVLELQPQSFQGVFRADFLFFFFFSHISFIFISWRLITLQYCSGFCHTLTWISFKIDWFDLPAFQGTLKSLL